MGVFSVFDIATWTPLGPGPAGEAALAAAERLVVGEPGVPKVTLFIVPWPWRRHRHRPPERAP